MKMDNMLYILIAASAFLCGCVSYRNEWIPGDIDNQPVRRDDISNTITTRNKYYIAYIKMNGAEFGTTSYHPQEVADFMPGVFVASPDAIPVTVILYPTYTERFSALSIFGYASTTTSTPMTIKVHTKPEQSVCAVNMLKISLRMNILSLFSFSPSSRTPYFLTGYLENLENMDQTKAATNFSKSFVTTVAIALKRLEDRTL